MQAYRKYFHRNNLQVSSFICFTLSLFVSPLSFANFEVTSSWFENKTMHHTTGLCNDSLQTCLEKSRINVRAKIASLPPDYFYYKYSSSPAPTNSVTESLTIEKSTYVMSFFVSEMRSKPTWGSYTVYDPQIGFGYRKIKTEDLLTASVCSVGYEVYRGILSQTANEFVPNGGPSRIANFRTNTIQECLAKTIEVSKSIKVRTKGPLKTMYFTQSKPKDQKGFADLSVITVFFGYKTQPSAWAMQQEEELKEITGPKN